MMKTFILTLKSKNIKSLNNYVTLLEKKLPGKSVCLTVINRLKKTKQFVTVLKSPHVNKTAQEQFERRGFLAQIRIYSVDRSKALIQIKKISKNLFHDTKLTVGCIITLPKAFKLNSFKSENFKLTSDKNIKKNKKLLVKNSDENKFQNIKKYIGILNISGEISLNKNV